MLYKPEFFSPGKSFQPSLMFICTVKSLPLEDLKGSSLGLALALLVYIKVGWNGLPVTNKHYSLLRTLVNYERKRFYENGSRMHRNGTGVGLI
jgi:hypothetical protein